MVGAFVGWIMVVSVGPISIPVSNSNSNTVIIFGDEANCNQAIEEIKKENEYTCEKVYTSSSNNNI